MSKALFRLLSNYTPSHSIQYIHTVLTSFQNMTCLSGTFANYVTQLINIVITKSYIHEH